VLISEFLNTDQLEEIENEQIEYLISECLSKIHAVYGYNFEWNDPETWIFDVLNEKEEELTGVKPNEFITSINKSFFEMSGSVMKTMYQPKTLFQYKKQCLK
jgi:deoxyhypusine synthase